jgi:hypothetical protein
LATLIQPAAAAVFKNLLLAIRSILCIFLFG